MRVNQAGYVASQPKLALVLSSRALRHATSTVVDARGHVVLHGRLGRSRGQWSARWPHVYAIDFSALTRPGTYVIRTTGARSPRFRVDSAAALYAPLAGNAVRFFQAQRDGPDAIAGVLGRAPSHLLDAHATVYAQPGYRGLRLLGPLRATGGPVDVAGGWFDAGDYLKFVETASFDDAMLLFALRELPTGTPDAPALRAEARFGIDWLAKMWDPARRVLYYQVGIGDGNGGSVLGDHDLWRLPQADDRRRVRAGSSEYFVSRRPVFAANSPGGAISPNLAGRTAGAFALCAQVFANVDPPYAQRCLHAAQAIYDQANTHPRGELLTASPHAYYSESEWRDDLELGAAELYLATRGVPAAGLPHPDANHYLPLAGRWADAYMSSPLNGQDSLNVYDVSALAHYDLARILESTEYQQLQRIPNNGIEVPTDPAALRADLRSQLRLATQRATRDPFRLASVSGNVDTVPHALGNAIAARLYGRLAGSTAFEPLARDQLDWALGKNPWNTSFVVGAGSTFPHCLSHEVANLSGSLTGNAPLLLGATVDGPTSGASVRDRGAPDGYRPCTNRSFASFDGHAMHYIDDVTSASTSEPTNDYAALALLAFAQQATR